MLKASLSIRGPNKLQIHSHLTVINVAKMNSRLPKMVKALLTNAGSCVLDFISSPNCTKQSWR